MSVHTTPSLLSPWTRPELALLVAAAMGLCGSAAARAGALAARVRPGPLVLEEVAKPLEPIRRRSEEEEDRIEALSLFAAARTHEKRQEHDQALRLYQRALRRDPGSVTIVRAIVPLAFRLGRPAEAVRYALKALELEDANPLLLERLGGYLIGKGDWRRAATLYEKALAARPGALSPADAVRLRMELGRLCHLIEDYPKAAECFAGVLEAIDRPTEFGLDEKRIQALLVEPAETYNLFGESFLRAGRLDEAVAAFEKAHGISADRGVLEFQRARVHAQRGRPQAALTALEACFTHRLAGEGMAPFELLAEVLRELGREDELLPRLEKLHAEDPKNVPLGYFLAGRYRQAGQLRKAESLYLSLKEDAPTLTGYRNLLQIYRHSDRPSSLLATLGEIVEKTGTLEMVEEEGGEIAADAGTMDALVEAARSRQEAEADSLGYGMRLAVALLALEGRRFETAAEFFELALQARPEQAADLLLRWGIGLLVEERPAQAAKVFRRAIREKALPEDDPAFYFYLAGALALDDQTEEALSAAQKAAELADRLTGEEQQDAARFHSRLPWVLYHAKRYDEAIQAYEELIREFDSDHSAPQVREVMREARLVLSNICVLKDDLPQAEEWLEQVLDEFPDDPGASNDLGYLWADQNVHLERALRMIQLAVEAEPDNVAYRDSLGWVLYRLGRYREAVAELQRAAVADDPPDPVILDHLGDAHHKAGQPQQAVQAWGRAAEAFRQAQQPQKAQTVEKKTKHIKQEK